MTRPGRLRRPFPPDAFPHGIAPCRAYMVVLPWPLRLILPSMKATTIGPVVFLRTFEPSASLLAHEAVHVWQWRRDGFARFAIRYVSDWVAGLGAGVGPSAAYLAIPAEREARRLSQSG